MTKFISVIVALSFCGIILLLSSFDQIPSKYKTIYDREFAYGDLIKLPGIVFETDKALLRQDSVYHSIDSLRKVFAFLQRNPTLVVEIDNFSDGRPRELYGQKPTYDRARTCVDSLVAWGISPERLLAKGDEDTKPFCTDFDYILPSGRLVEAGRILTESYVTKMAPDKKSADYEFLRALNRRTELYILGTWYFPRMKSNAHYKTLNDSVFVFGDIVQVPGIHFELGSYPLKNDSMANGSDSLRKVFVFLQRHPNLVVEIAQHADTIYQNRSTRITQGRAQACVDSLIKWGIEKSRISAHGYGDSQPYLVDRDLKLPSGKVMTAGTYLTGKFIYATAPDRNSADFQFMRALNRRTEVRILRTDYDK